MKEKSITKSLVFSSEIPRVKASAYDDGLSNGAIAGIVIAVILIVLIAIDLFCCFFNSCGLIFCCHRTICGGGGGGGKGDKAKKCKLILWLIRCLKLKRGLDYSKLVVTRWYPNKSGNHERTETEWLVLGLGLQQN